MAKIELKDWLKAKKSRPMFLVS